MQLTEREIRIANLVGLRVKDITPEIAMILKESTKYTYDYNAAKYVKDMLQCN